MGGLRTDFKKGRFCLPSCLPDLYEPNPGQLKPETGLAGQVARPLLAPSSVDRKPAASQAMRDGGGGGGVKNSFSPLPRVTPLACSPLSWETVATNVMEAGRPALYRFHHTWLPDQWAGSWRWRWAAQGRGESEIKFTLHPPYQKNDGALAGPDHSPGTLRFLPKTGTEHSCSVVSNQIKTSSRQRSFFFLFEV